MSTYTRPVIEPLVFYDAAGQTIDYGNRWKDGPPDDSYSVEENPSRFAPLHTVANALIDHLIANYQVRVDEGYHVTDGFQHAPKPSEVVRAVRITPLADGCAPIVITLTSFPGVRLNAGVLFT